MDDCVPHPLNSPLRLTSQVKMSVVKQKFHSMIFASQRIIMSDTQNIDLGNMYFIFIFFGMFGNCSCNLHHRFNTTFFQCIKFPLIDSSAIRRFFQFNNTLDITSPIPQFNKSNLPRRSQLVDPSFQNNMLTLSMRKYL